MVDGYAELHSMSKGFNMTGRGRPLVRQHADRPKSRVDVKDNSDSGQFLAVQGSSAGLRAGSS